MEKTNKESAAYLRLWRDLSLVHRKDDTPMTDRERAMALSNFDHWSKSFPLAEYPRDPPASQYEGPMGLWSALEGNVITAEQAREIAIPNHEATIARCARWITHYQNRLAYERAMLDDAGGTVADKTRPEKGGAVRCWASPGFGRGWSYIQKVNKVSVTVLDNHGNGGRNFRRVIAFDQLKGVMSAAAIDAARAAEQVRETSGGLGFFLCDEPPAPAIAIATEVPEAKDFDAMKETLRAGIKVAVVPQLFPTPPELAERVIAAADIKPGHRVLEPSAGTGALLAAIPPETNIIAVEINPELAHLCRMHDTRYRVHIHDFLACLPGCCFPAEFDRIVINPPFADQQDIRHVRHALRFLKRGGRLVAIMSAAVTFREDRMARDFREMVDDLDGTIEPLPEDSFKASGTDVRAVLVTIDTNL